MTESSLSSLSASGIASEISASSSDEESILVEVAEAREDFAEAREDLDDFAAARDAVAEAEFAFLDFWVAAGGFAAAVGEVAAAGIVGDGPAWESYPR